MIEPQVEHGGASSWFCIAANDVIFGDVIATVAEAPAAAATSSGSCSGVITSSSRKLSSARDCAASERDLFAIQRKM